MISPKQQCAYRVVGAVAAACVVSAAAYFYKTRTVEIHEVMFNAYDRFFNKLMSCVEKATKSVDVYLPSIQDPAIQALLVKVAKQKKIPLLILIDRDGYNESSKFLLKQLIDAGAEIKCTTVNWPYKQHKFCVIDGEILVGHWEYWDRHTGAGAGATDRHDGYCVYVTDTSDVVRPVREEFDQMRRTGLAPAEAVNLSPAGSETDDSELLEMDGSNESFDLEELE